ncbi:hypothetical protein GD627_09630 [Arthrobacter yangruifuii]|uniref:Uncharacterized protein n=1 Tax=Arthrobacter yangruifuii TaxID=2606616 RepID=A0A5N6MHQ7_9MICC|nr:hypothetical protein [Arthrobacter yangruifuii]KAD3633090.1 hypothetical protein GD627_09630 [Arthrobacter yangruifuii]
MDTNALPQAPANARSILLPYTLVLVTAMLLIQIGIALNDGAVGLLAGILTAAVAAGTAAWMWRSYRRLIRVRFGFAVAHAIAFVTVTTSFNLHAAFLVFAAGSGTEAADILLGSPWFGATVLMSAAWGMGLLVHLAGSVLGRGWED